jgi:hypothetical protein
LAAVPVLETALGGLDPGKLVLVHGTKAHGSHDDGG